MPRKSYPRRIDDSLYDELKKMAEEGNCSIVDASADAADTLHELEGSLFGRIIRKKRQ